MQLTPQPARAAGCRAAGLHWPTSTNHPPRPVHFRLALLIAGALSSAAAWGAPKAGEDARQAQMVLTRLEATALEHGEGVTRDTVRAAKLYCDAAREGDAESQYSLGWMYANGRGVERDDRAAAYFFHAAAEQGVAQAQAMLHRVGAPDGSVPACMIPPPPPAPVVVQASPPAPQPVLAPKAIAKLVDTMAPAFKVEPQLVLAIMKAESNFDVDALSPKNAMGLMQLIPETAERFNVTNPYDAKQNIRGGMAYLRWLLAYFEGDVALVAAAYNAGEGTVERYRGVPPYRETREYVQRILRTLGAVALPYDKRITSPSPRLAAIREQRTALR
jgi:soluble lytic murein transglycosylase-like protein